MSYRNDTRERVFEILSECIETEGIVPTLRELAELSGLASTSTVNYHLRNLEQEGRIVRSHGSSRWIKIKREESDMPIPGDARLEEPEPEEGIEGKLTEIHELEIRAKREHTNAKTQEEREYWQGRKDGLRVALSILEPGDSTWEQLINSSPGFRMEEKEALIEILKDARYNVGAALDDYATRSDGGIHPQTLINLLQWLDLYDRKAKKGELPELKDAITPSWREVTNRKKR